MRLVMPNSLLAVIRMEAFSAPVTQAMMVMVFCAKTCSNVILGFIPAHRRRSVQTLWEVMNARVGPVTKATVSDVLMLTSVTFGQATAVGMLNATIQLGASLALVSMGTVGMVFTAKRKK
eukprot:Rmarinus@m.23579